MLEQMQFHEARCTYYVSIREFDPNEIFSFGLIQQLRGQEIVIFWPPPPPLWRVFIPWAWTKTDVFDSLPPSSCPRSYWMDPFQCWLQVSHKRLNHYNHMYQQTGDSPFCVFFHKNKEMDFKYLCFLSWGFECCNRSSVQYIRKQNKNIAKSKQLKTFFFREKELRKKVANKLVCPMYFSARTWV